MHKNPGEAVCSILAAAVAVCLATAALAHDFWVRPASFRVGVGGQVQTRLFVGMDMQGEARAFKKDRVKAFTISGASTEGKPVPMVSTEGGDPAGTFGASKPGLHVITYQSRESTIVLAPDKFDEYLREEGLEHIIAERERLGEKAANGREAYSRCATSMIVVGDATDGLWAGPRGLPIELVPVTNPAAAKPGDTLKFTLLRDGKPLKDAKVVARCETTPKEPASARTDQNGIVEFKVGTAGVWMVTSVTMERATGRQDVDWVSWWASLTFEVAAPSAAPAGTT